MLPEAANDGDVTAGRWCSCTDGEEMISAWRHSSVTLLSPDKRHTAIINRLYEVAMGAPTCGDLSVDNRCFGPGFGPSAVWSDDSKYLVLPRWVETSQVLCLVNVEANEIFVGKTRFGVLQLAELKNGILTGVDSPIYKKQKLRIPISKEFRF